jgi:hypothetical protein
MNQQEQEKVMPTGTTLFQREHWYEHQFLPTISRLVEMGITCPLCNVSFDTGIPYVEGYQGKQGTQGR